MKNSFESNLITPCGMNCGICVSFFGYAVNGRKRKNRCIGCRSRDKNCAFLKKRCDKLKNNTVNFCFECKIFPCDDLKNLDRHYREKYKMSMIENLKYLKKYGMNNFLEKEKNKWECPNCAGVICVHTNKCYSCENK